MLPILIVDDNPADVQLVREAMRVFSVPAELIIASDGEEALRLLSEARIKPGFILLDLNLPKFSGLDLLERYQGKDGPPVVVLSGSENPGDKKRALELGATEYNLKPIGFEEFVQLVGSTIERWGTRAVAACS